MTGGAARGTGCTFLGRRDELAELRAGLDDVASGRGRAFLVAGEAGVGKTRLVEMLVQDVELTEVQAVVGRCRQPRARPPFWPWAQVLDACVAGLPDEALEHHLGPGAADVAVLVPQLARRLPEVVRAPPSASPDARLRLFDSVTAFLGNVAADGGLLVALDDLHAADEASLRLLLHVVERIGQSPILLVGTYRDADVRSVPHLHRAIAAIGRYGRRLVLAGLDGHDAGALLEEVIGEPVDPALADEVQFTADGNPFFVQEIARLLRTEDDGRRSPIPEDVHDVVGRRLATASPAASEALEVAAVISRPFDLALLGAVGGIETQALESALDEARALDVIVPTTTGRWWFSHELVHETLYDRVRISRRIVLHRRVAEVLEKQLGSDATAGVAELAHHLFEAARGGDGVKAQQYCALAGDAAMTSLAFEEAAIQYGRALEALAVAPPVDERERHRLLMCLGRAYLRLGDLGQARECQRRALKAARAMGSPELLADAAVGFVDEPAWADDETQGSVFAEARAALPGQDHPLLARLLVASAATARNPEAAVRLADEGLAMARRVGDTDTLRACLLGRLEVESGPDDSERRLAVASELLAMGDATGDLELRQRALQWRGRERFAAGDIAGAHADLQVAAEDARRLRLPSLVAAAAAWGAGVATLEGRFDDAERLAGDDLFHPLYLLRRDQGRFEEMADLARRLLAGSDNGEQALGHALLAMAMAELAKLEEARLEIGGVAHDLLHRPGPGLPARAAVVADVSWMLGTAEWAESAQECLLRWPERHVVLGAGGSLGASSRYLGQLATLLGRFADAESHFEAAHRFHERLGAPAVLAHGRLDHARMLLARAGPDDVARARHLAAAARQAYRKMGMATHAERAAALLEGPSADAVGAPEAGVFALEGEYWAVDYGGREVRIRDSKGLRYLARLLRAPGQELHALDLVVGEGGRAPARPGSAREAGLETVTSGDAGAVLDAKAKAAYKRRLEELEAEIDEAAVNNDLGRSERAQQEKDFLLRELTAAVGLGGRDRKAASDAERARQSVTRAVKGAIERIAAAHPQLGEHLRTTVRTGIYSCYAPDPRAPIRWRSR